jgi:hypothetical protein
MVSRVTDKILLKIKTTKFPLRADLYLRGVSHKKQTVGMNDF